MGKKLNLGCGRFPKPGYVNVDIDENAKADVRHDLSVFPYPFGDGEFARIEADHVVEHLDDPIAVMRECHRMLRSDGRLIVRVPHFSRGLTHWDHRRGFDVTFPLYFDSGFEGGYVGFEFKHVRTHLTWFGQRYLKKRVLGSFSYYAGVILGSVFDLIGNVNHYMTSRLLCFYVGGYDEIEFTFEKTDPR